VGEGGGAWAQAIGSGEGGVAGHRSNRAASGGAQADRHDQLGWPRSLNQPLALRRHCRGQPTQLSVAQLGQGLPNQDWPASSRLALLSLESEAAVCDGGWPSRQAAVATLAPGLLRVAFGQHHGGLRPWAHGFSNPRKGAHAPEPFGG